jgi:hypothetical protein
MYIMKNVINRIAVTEFILVFAVSLLILKSVYKCLFYYEM